MEEPCCAPAQGKKGDHMPNDHSARQYHVDAAKYQEMYAASVADPEAFWAEQGKRIDWIKPYSQV